MMMMHADAGRWSVLIHFLFCELDVISRQILSATCQQTDIGHCGDERDGQTVPPEIQKDT